MADWVHCNLCFHQPGDGRKFSLTNCGHIYCELCLKEGAGGKCKMCGSTCTSIALSSKMKPDVEIFFTDPADLLQKHKRELIQVMDFQKNHRRRLNAYIREKMSKQGKVIQISQKNISQFQEMERNILKLKEENSYLKKLINDKGISGGSRSGTPGRLSSSPVGGYRVSPGRMGQSSSPYRDSSTCTPGSQRPTATTPDSHRPSATTPGSHRPSATTPGSQRPPSTTPGSQRHDRFYQAESSQNASLQLVGSQHMASAVPPSLSRVSVRTPPTNGRMGNIQLTPSPIMTGPPKSAGIRQSTPGAGEALRRSNNITLQSPVPMNVGTPSNFSLQTPTSQSTMSQYRHAVNTVSPAFTIHTPRGADTLVT